MRDLLIISGVLALFALVFLIKAAHHTWHIEVLRNHRRNER